MCRTSLKVNKLVLSSQIFLNPSIPLFLCSVRPTEDWYEQLYPLILALKDCMGEVVNRAKQSLTFVLLQELAYSLPQCLMLTLRRDIVFSQAVGASCFCELSTLMGCQIVSSVRKEIFLEQSAFTSILFGHTAWPVGSWFPDQGSNPCPLHWKLGVLVIEPPGKSSSLLFKGILFLRY